ncbi:MAG: hypothetical protein H0W45_00885 [Acidobacteria bacterium]|nr:hypothetical protein [Acidobacteriota bacterium]
MPAKYAANAKQKRINLIFRQPANRHNAGIMRGRDMYVKFNPPSVLCELHDMAGRQHSRLNEYLRAVTTLCAASRFHSTFEATRRNYPLHKSNEFQPTHL